LPRDPPVGREIFDQFAGLLCGPVTGGAISFAIRHFGKIIQGSNGVDGHIKLDRAHASRFDHDGAFRPAIRI
jgi:hypothetical protein